MRKSLVALACILSVGCGSGQAPNIAQQARQTMAPQSERIVPAALTGLWNGEKGSLLTFGSDRSISVRFGLEGKEAAGSYRFEAHKLFRDQEALGWILLQEPDQFTLVTSREVKEVFRRFV